MYGVVLGRRALYWLVLLSTTWHRGAVQVLRRGRGLTWGRGPCSIEAGPVGSVGGWRTGVHQDAG